MLKDMYYNSTHKLALRRNSYCVKGGHVQDYNRREQEAKEEGPRLQMHGKFLKYLISIKLQDRGLGPTCSQV